MFASWSKFQKWAAAIVVASVLAVAITLIVVFTAKGTELKSYNKGAVATDGAPCQQIARSLFEAGGTTVEVAIGTLFCEGVASPQSMGLGGGFIMTIYNRTTRESFTFNAREAAPAAAHEDMFHGNSTLSLEGGLAVAIPGELKGYHILYQKYGGRLKWRQLIEPTIKICEEGIPVTRYIANTIQNKKASILASPTLSEFLVNSATGDVLKQGDIMKRTRLAKTLKIIAEEGGLAIHNGSLTRDFVKDIQDKSGIVTVEDMNNYEPLRQEAIKVPLPGGLQLITAPPPGSGALLAFFLLLTAGHVPTPLNVYGYHRMVESMKFMYGFRTELADTYPPSNHTDNINKLVAQLTDPKYADSIRANISLSATSSNPADYGAVWSQVDNHGTAHVAVIGEDAAVSVTSTINTEFGAKFVSPSTGIILNNEMDDFSVPGVSSSYGVPPSPANFIRPGKRPLSSMVPSIITDVDGNVRLIIGGSGGTRITSAVGTASLYNLYLGMKIDEAVSQKRIHHQLMPMYIQCEEGFDPDLARAFKVFGHEVKSLSTTSSSLMAIAVDGNKYTPLADHRRDGVSDGW